MNWKQLSDARRRWIDPRTGFGLGYIVQGAGLCLDRIMKLVHGNVMPNGCRAAMSDRHRATMRHRLLFRPVGGGVVVVHPRRHGNRIGTMRMPHRVRRRTVPNDEREDVNC